MISQYLFYGALGVFALRVAIAAVLVVHGWAKIRNIKGTSEWFASIGFKPGKLFAMLAAAVEFFGGILLLVGFLTQTVALLVALEFVVILVWRFSKKSPFVGGWEIDLLILGGVIALFFLGGGAYALDKIFFLGLI